VFCPVTPEGNNRIAAKIKIATDDVSFFLFVLLGYRESISTHGHSQWLARKCCEEMCCEEMLTRKVGHPIVTSIPWSSEGEMKFIHPFSLLTLLVLVLSAASVSVFAQCLGWAATAQFARLT
jgi:hypothetical protein